MLLPWLSPSLALARSPSLLRSNDTRRTKTTGRRTRGVFQRTYAFPLPRARTRSCRRATERNQGFIPASTGLHGLALHLLAHPLPHVLRALAASERDRHGLPARPTRSTPPDRSLTTRAWPRAHTRCLTHTRTPARTCPCTQRTHPPRTRRVQLVIRAPIHAPDVLDAPAAAYCQQCTLFGQTRACLVPSLGQWTKSLLSVIAGFGKIKWLHSRATEMTLVTCHRPLPSFFV